MEEWADEAAAGARRVRASVKIFQEAWSHVSDPAIAPLILGMETQPNEYEELITKVALELFPVSGGARDLERVLHEGRRFTTTAGGLLWLRNMVARFIRVGERRKYYISVTPSNLLEYYFQVLPVQVENEVRAVGPHKDVEEAHRKAQLIEAEYRRRGLSPAVHLGTMAAYPADGMEDGEVPRDSVATG